MAKYLLYCNSHAHQMKESEKVSKDVYWKIVDPSSDDESEYSEEEEESEAMDDEDTIDKKGNDAATNDDADPAWDVKVQEDEEEVGVRKRFRGFNK